MATRAERAHADSQRTGAATKRATGAKKATKKRRGHTSAKATVAREERSADGRASRKSTRGSANRAKAGSSLDIREELQMSSPESRSRNALAKTKRVRGSS
jgi:hypothetical protein